MKKRTRQPPPSIDKGQALRLLALTQLDATTIGELRRAAFPHDLAITFKARPAPPAKPAR